VGGVTWGWLHASCNARLRGDTLTTEQVSAFEQSEVMVVEAALELKVSNQAIREFAGWVRTCEVLPVVDSLHEAFFENDKIRDFTLGKCVAFYNRKIEDRPKLGTRTSDPPSSARRRTTELVFKVLLLVMVVLVGRRLFK
jgi:hypothetical protein